MALYQNKFRTNKKRNRTTCPSANNSLHLRRPGGIKNAYHRGRQAKDREIPTAEQTPGRFTGSNVAAIDGITPNLFTPASCRPPTVALMARGTMIYFLKRDFAIGSTIAPAFANRRYILTNVLWLLYTRREDMTKIYL